MGCDIHMFAEIQVRPGKWAFITLDSRLAHKIRAARMKFTADDRGLDAFEALVRLLEPKPDEKTYNMEIYSGRDYDLFSILASVRCYDGSPAPISQPRGVPDDASTRIKDIVESWGTDGHSHSWLGLDELLAYNAAHPEKNHYGKVKERNRNTGLNETMRDVIAKLASFDDAKNIRIVFFFDN